MKVHISDHHYTPGRFHDTLQHVCEHRVICSLYHTETEGAGEQLEGKQRQAAGGSGPPVSGDRTPSH